MTSNWKKYIFKNFANFKYGKMPSKSKITDDGKYPVYSGYRYVGRYNEYNIDKETLIIVARGVGGTGDVKLTKEKCYLTNLSIAVENIKKTIVNTVYLYYYFQIHNLRYLDSGSAQSQITISDLEKLEILLPPLETQQKIAKVLSAIDDKIELNNSINNNLEQQAQAIFKSWFVDFEPFNGIIPDDWSEDILGNFIEIKRGGSPRPIQDYIADSGYRWLKISDATSIQSPFILNIKEHIKESGINKTVLLKSGSLVLSNSATPGIPKILDVDSCIHDGWLYFPKSMLSNEYLYLLFKFIRPNLVALGNGSVFTNLKTDILRNYNTILPDKETLTKFDGVVSAIFKQILYNTRENEKLIQLRDTLLPKLMSGEIDVSKVDISTDKLLFSEEKYVNE